MALELLNLGLAAEDVKPAQLKVQLPFRRDPGSRRDAASLQLPEWPVLRSETITCLGQVCSHSMG